MLENAFQSLRGHLIIAMPSLEDENFQRTVVLLAEHTPEGAFGVIVNRPLHLKLKDLFQNQHQGFAITDVVWFGGPVEPQRGLFLHNIPLVPMRNPITLENDLYICGNLDSVEYIANLRGKGLDQDQHFRFFLGYSGWAPGQLEHELRQSSWLHCKATRSLILETTPEDLWETAIRSLGVAPESLVDDQGSGGRVLH